MVVLKSTTRLIAHPRVFFHLSSKSHWQKYLSTNNCGKSRRTLRWDVSSVPVGSSCQKRQQIGRTVERGVALSALCWCCCCYCCATWNHAKLQVSIKQLLIALSCCCWRPTAGPAAKLGHVAPILFRTHFGLYTCALCEFWKRFLSVVWLFQRCLLGKVFFFVGWVGSSQTSEPTKGK